MLKNISAINDLCVFMLALLGLANTMCGSDSKGDPCKPDDADGILGTKETLQVTATDDGFEPKVLTVQNRTDVTLKLINESSQERGFVIDCKPTPNDDGCALESCFPTTSNIAPIAPGASATAQFEVPLVEGIYDFRSGVDGDAQTGQFIVQ